ncbi:MgtC/SapB family protein [Paraflavitalea pollutisoli]|uniref:MgtC/SapB family protein n=1 Tax=Paraflavitalea pollutisoli TaxID=3034143 RepID=UPI0023ED8EAC|nr:MgtC/SapB family protein [Paraflavitalea sp. H1-2-19X]
MDWNTELILIFRTLLSCLLGAAIGIEREFHGKEAGIRTYAAVALGSCTFGLISQHVGPVVDTRIASTVVTGIGFLGAGIIFKENSRVSGLTTAATIWSTAAMALAIAFGMYILGILTAVIIFITLVVHDLPFWKRFKEKFSRQHDTKDSGGSI